MSISCWSTKAPPHTHREYEILVTFLLQKRLALKGLNATFIRNLPVPPPFRKKPSLVHIREPDTSHLQSNFLRILRFFSILSLHINLCLPNGILRLNFVNKIIVTSCFPLGSSPASELYMPTPGNYPKENIIYSEHGASLKWKIIVAYLIGTFDYALLALVCLCFDCRDASALSDVTVSGSKSYCLFTVQRDATYYKAVSIVTSRKPVVRIVLFVTISFRGPVNSRCGDWLRVGRSGIESRWGRDFSPVQTCPWAHPASCKMGTVSFPGVKCGWACCWPLPPF